MYYEKGEFYSAEKLYLQAKELRKKIVGENHPDYVNTLNGLAVLYQESGNYKKAEPVITSYSIHYTKLYEEVFLKCSMKLLLLADSIN